MAGRKSIEPSAESVARADRLRLAREDGVKAMADVAREAVAVRKNMERLRVLREAREAEQASQPQVNEPNAAMRKRKGKTKNN